MRIGIAGTGLMGFPMAKRLMLFKHELHVWNRSIDKARPLESMGAIVHPDIVQMASQVDVLILMLQDGETVAKVLFDMHAAASLKNAGLVIDMSSIKPVEARLHAVRLESMGLRYLDAPVSGGTGGAERGTLAIMVGGDQAIFDIAEPIFAALGTATLVGPHGAGQLTKLANQMIVGITIGAVAEALLLAARGGADIAQVRRAVTGGFAASRVLEIHGLRMVERDFAPRARISVQLKDLRNALHTAEECGFDAPITKVLEGLFASAAMNGLHDLDHSALFIEIASLNSMR